jgi:asparagine synthetase B (glutamine-hydrolysing)
VCGIAGVYLRDPNARADLNRMLDTMLDQIEHRGGDATGFVAIGNEGALEWQKAACGATDFAKERRPVPKGTRTILCHTRWATQGSPAFVENNHPLNRGSFFVIHNGHINNDAKLFELANRSRYGRVDSEAIPARFASFGKLSAAPKVMAELEGAAAIAAVDESAPAELVLARGAQSPLFVLTTKKYVLWGSTHATVKVAYEKHIGRLPKRAKIQSVAEGTVLHYVNGKLTKRSFVAWTPPKVIYTPKTYKYASPEGHRPAETVTVSLSDDWKSPEAEDFDACDACGTEVYWNDLQYRWVEEEDVTWQLCPDCEDLWSYQGRERVSNRIHDALDAEWAEVNKHILDEDAE